MGYFSIQQSSSSYQRGEVGTVCVQEVSMSAVMLPSPYSVWKVISPEWSWFASMIFYAVLLVCCHLFLSCLVVDPNQMLTDVQNTVLNGSTAVEVG